MIEEAYLKDITGKVFYTYQVIKLDDEYSIEVHKGNKYGKASIELIGRSNDPARRGDRPTSLCINYEEGRYLHIRQVPEKIERAFRMFVTHYRMREGF